MPKVAAQTHFDDIADEYDESLPPHVVEHYLAKRVAFVRELLPSGSILDVGCGTGVVATRLADEGFHVTGLDPSAGMLDVLRQRDPRVNAFQGSATELPFDEGSFDLTMCVAVMHHIAAPDAVRNALAEMVRVTKPSGLILVWDHNPRNPYWKHLMARVPQDDGSERLIPESELIEGLTAGSATVLSNQTLGFVPDFIPVPLLSAMVAIERKVETLPGLKSLCAHTVVVGQRTTHNEV